jgi:hypothetical protein
VATYKLKVYRWDEKRARARAPLELIHEGTFPGPDNHDAAKREALAAAGRVVGGRVVSSSTLALPGGKALAPGAPAPGFTVTVDVKG